MDDGAAGTTSTGGNMDCRNKSGNDSIFDVIAARQRLPPLSFTDLFRESMPAADKIS
jgi:hypothetical protein